MLGKFLILSKTQVSLSINVNNSYAYLQGKQ